MTREITKEKRKIVRRDEDSNLRRLSEKVKELEKDSIRTLVRLESLEKTINKIDHKTDEMDKSFKESCGKISEMLEIYTKSKGAIWFLKIAVAVGAVVIACITYAKAHIIWN
jgi:cytochrome c-type biogenesis protein CcmH/NrfG